MRELNAIKASDRSDAQKKELTALLQKAVEFGSDVSKFLSEDFDVEAYESRSVNLDDDGDLTADAVKALVKESVLEANKGNVSADDIKALEAKLDNLGSTDPAEIKKAITDVIGKQSSEADLAKAIEKAVANHQPAGSVSKEEFNTAISDLKKSFENQGKGIQFPAGGGAGGQSVDYPVEHRAGNMTVAQKQLLNIMLNATVGMKEAQIETLMNEGISDDALAYAKACGQKSLASLRQKMVYGGKTLVTGTTNSGAELIATDLSSELLNRMYLESDLAAEFVASEIDMPTKSFELPIRTTRPTFYTGAENPGSNPTESSPATANVTLTAQKLIGRTNFSYEADEDAIIAVLPMVTENLASAAADALEGAIINGDTTATHMDSDIHAVTNHHAKLFKGLRKYANAGSLSRSLATGGISATNVLTLKKDMLRWGLKPSDLLIVAGVKGYADFIGLDETLTADKVGSDQARILTGMAPSLYGSKILVSSQVREDLTSAGIYDGVTETKGSFLMIHRPSWMLGVRKGFTVEIDRDIQQQVNIVVASFRRDLKPLETPSASLPYVAQGIDYNS